MYCFLEGHLNAPKIFSKLEMKTSTSMYVNGSDGVHFLKLPDGNYQLVFGESKTIKKLSNAIYDAFKSIDQFINEVNDKGNAKSGINFEKRLISDNLDRESWDNTEKEFLTKLIYPTTDETFDVDDAFGIFVGFQITPTDAQKKQAIQRIKKQLKPMLKPNYQKN
ncbi:HamA C-terminal domain-containing protein [Bacillus pacificus]